MRISTSMLYDQGVTAIQQQYGSVLKLQQQISTGRRMLTPSDDPAAAARAMDVSQSLGTYKQYSANIDAAVGALQMQDAVLAQVGDVLQTARMLALNAGNPSLSASDRGSLATELQSNYQHLLGLANATDGNGQYLFSGFKGATQPFSETAPGVVAYNGDQGQRLLQISASRQIPVSSSGADVFQRLHNGNGVFVTAAASANTGSGVVGTGMVLNSTSLTGHNYALTFNITAGNTSYDVVDTTNSTTVLTGQAYTSGSAIAFDGMQFDVSGQPANGDSFTVKPSATNQDLFTTLHDLIASLQSGKSGAPITNANNTALSNITLAQDSLLAIRATVGASLKESDVQRSTNEDLIQQYQSTLSQLQDLDYAKAISDLSQKQASLDAAQKSFLKVQTMSLFSYINP